MKMHKKYWLAGLIGVLTLGGSGLWAYQKSIAPTSNSADPNSSSADPNPSPLAINTPTPTSSPTGSSTSSPTASPAASPVASPTKSPASPTPVTLSAEEKALNEKAKAEFQATTAGVDSAIPIKVAIAEGVPAVPIGAVGSAQISDQNHTPIRTINGVATAQPSGGGISLGGDALPKIIWVEPTSPDGLLQMGDRQYRGVFLVVNDGGRIWVVNHVDLRNYLYSVVGSEVSPSWEMDALKAQSVAARSYALTYHFKPMSGLFDLGATEYYQVYKGIQSEAASVKQAVDATAGEYISQKGGVVETLYAASDDIVAEAFQGQGMSQLGALSLAEQGQSYTNILANYYPSTKVGKYLRAIE
jgi:stage II sporulation protein D